MLNENHLYISSHDKLCLPLIERIYKKMLIGVQFHAIKVNDRLIIDGHHRYAAALLSGYKLECVPYPKSSAKINYAWNSVQLMDEEWERPENIVRYNKLDAKLMGMPLEEFLERIK